MRVQAGACKAPTKTFDGPVYRRTRNAQKPACVSHRALCQGNRHGAVKCRYTLQNAGYVYPQFGLNLWRRKGAFQPIDWLHSPVSSACRVVAPHERSNAIADDAVAKGTPARPARVKQRGFAPQFKKGILCEISTQIEWQPVMPSRSRRVNCGDPRGRGE
jgi:hypothetical protein